MVIIDDLDLLWDEESVVDSDSLHQEFLENVDNLFPWRQMYRLKDDWTGWAVPIKQDKAILYNSPAQQYSIFFSPNGSFADSQGTRQKATAKKINCFCIERDDSPTSKVKFWENFPIQPTLVVETYRWYHAYWVLKESVDYISNAARWDEIQTWMCKDMGWDIKAKDIARVYRFPWYEYWKMKHRPAEWFRPSVFALNKDIRYTFDDVYDVCKKYEDVAKESADYKKFTKTKTEAGNFERINAETDVIQILNEFSTRWEIKWLRIYEDGKLTSWYRYYENKNCLVSFSREDRPQWWPFSVAKYFLGSDWDTFKYFAEKHGIGEWKKKNMDVKKDVVSDVYKNMFWEKEWETDYVAQVGSKKLVVSYTDKKIYKVIDDWMPIEIVSWVFRPIGHCKKPAKNWWTTNTYIMEFEKVNEETGEVISGRMYGEALGGKDKLKKLLSENGITFVGWKPYDELLHEYIAVKWREEHIYVDKAGIYWKDFIVDKPGMYIKEHEWQKYFVDIRWITPTDKKKWLIFDISGNAKLSDVMSALWVLSSSYYTPIAHTSFTAVCMSLFLHYIRTNINKMPILQFSGMSQSGKTTMKNHLLATIGMDPCLRATASSTHFPIMMMSKHYLPLSISEYENKNQKFDRDGMCKNNFDNAQEVRGTKDQLLNAYELNAMLFIDGEMRSMTNSVYTRTITQQYAKHHRKWVIKWEVQNISSYFINNYEKIESLQRKIPKYENYISEKLADVEKAEKWRISENYAMLMAFADCFWFIDTVKESLLVQCREQLMLMGEDNMDKIIKTLFSSAKMGKMLTKVRDGCIIIDYVLDVSKVNAKLIADMESQITNLNAHFWPEEDMVSDRISIPLSYLFKQKKLHDALNSILDHAFYRATPDPAKEWSTRLAIKEYAKSNWYTDCRFYELLVEDHGDFYEQRNQKNTNGR